jgi:WD40 repeat protein
MLGLIAPRASEIKWVGTLGGKKDKKYSANNIRRLAPTDNGAYVAAAGWDNGLALLDSSSGEQLWWTRPPNEVSSTYAAFAPDNKVIYTGGGEGCVYGLDVKTGKIVSQWFASKSGKSEYGHRISDIAVSPDGKWVAAGTGPEGLVWVFDAAKGKAVRILKHGGSTVLMVSFSPESSALVSFVPGSLKVWDVEQWSEPNVP